MSAGRSGICARLSVALFSRWLAAPPAAVRLSAATTSDAITATFAYAPPSPYNAADEFELQVFPADADLLRVLGDAADWVTFYRGPARSHTLDALPPERAVRLRARACNARGDGPWCDELLGPGYRWDQTPEEVEALVAAPPGTAARVVDVTVMPRRIRVALRGGAGGAVVLLEGPLGGEARGSEPGDYEWELRGAPRRPLTATPRLPTLPPSSAPRVDLRSNASRQCRAAGGAGDRSHDRQAARAPRRAPICMPRTRRRRTPVRRLGGPSRRAACYDPAGQWPCLVAGPEHPQIDLGKLRWERQDRPWRPPQDARTLARPPPPLIEQSNVCSSVCSMAPAQEEVSQALPDMRIADAPLAYAPPAAAPPEDEVAWGLQWRRRH